MTLTLTLVAQRMFHQQVLVKNLAAVETFNSVTVIATDKTGTLTTNVMSVANIFYGLTGSLSSSIASRGVGIHAHDTKHSLNYAAYRLLIQGAQLCNNAALRSSGGNSSDQEDDSGSSPPAAKSGGIADLTAAVQSLSAELTSFTQEATAGQHDGANVRLVELANNPSVAALFGPLPDGVTPTYSIHGDAADSAFYTFCLTHLGLNVEMTRAMFAREFVLPFNSKNKFMVTVHKDWSYHDKRHAASTTNKKDETDQGARPTAVRLHTAPTKANPSSSSPPVEPLSPPAAATSSSSSSSMPPPSSIYPPVNPSPSHPHLVWMKGACEIILTRCTTYITDTGLEAPLTPTILKQLLQRLESLGKQGERVLGFARRQMDFHDWRQKDEAQRQQALADGEQQASDSREEKATANDPPGVPSREFCFVGMISLSP